MKKLLQICFIAIFVFVLFQVVAGGAALAAGGTNLALARHDSIATGVAAEDTHASACRVWNRGVFCAIPNVGWNS